MEEAIYLTKFARKVTVIHRRNELRAAKSIQEKAFRNPKMNFMWDSVVEELHGDGILSGMTVRNVKTGELTRVDADPDDGMFGLFGFIGNVPRSELFEGLLDMKKDISRRTKTCAPAFRCLCRRRCPGQEFPPGSDGQLRTVQLPLCRQKNISLNWTAMFIDRPIIRRR